MKKKHVRRIKEINEQMGERQYVSYEWLPISGEDVLLSGLCTHPNFKGIKVEREKMYELKSPIFHSESNEKELKRQFAQNGEKGIYQVVRTEHDRRLSPKTLNKFD